MKPESVKLGRRSPGTDDVSPMKTTKRKSKSNEKAASAPAVEPVATAERAPPSSGRVLALSSHCTIKDAAQLKADLTAFADESAEVILDVGSIERIDTATMQLICAFVRDCGQRDRKVTWKGDSQSWRDAVRLLGTAQVLRYASEEAQR